MGKPLYICGPTASGKSSLAIAIAKLIDGEVVNSDAYQIYRGIETLTAAPSFEEQNEVPHHLFSLLSTNQEFDANQYRQLALPILADIQSRGKVPIVVGGSGMYLKFLTHGTSPVPASDPKVRKKLELYDDDELVKKLKSIDPEGAEITNLKNRRYIIRALEICLISGQKMSVIKSDWKNASKKIEKDLRGGIICWESNTLRKRIAQRTRDMLASGAIEEVIHNHNFSSTCEKAIGIRQIRSYLAGEIDKADCEEKIFYATCRYAKRQRTWFNKESWLTPLHYHSETDARKVALSLVKSTHII